MRRSGSSSPQSGSPPRQGAWRPPQGGAGQSAQEEAHGSELWVQCSIGLCSALGPAAQQTELVPVWPVCQPPGNLEVRRNPMQSCHLPLLEPLPTRFQTPPSPASTAPGPQGGPSRRAQRSPLPRREGAGATLTVQQGMRARAGLPPPGRSSQSLQCLPSSATDQWAVPAEWTAQSNSHRPSCPQQRLFLVGTRSSEV